jgi:hypothetical protein
VVTDERDGADQRLADELAAVLARVAAPPPGAARVARELFAWRTVDAELAALAFDSLLDETASDTAPAARSASGPRLVVFAAGELAIEVEVDEQPGGRRLHGQLVPARPATLELRQPTAGPSGAISTATDGLGRFRLPLPAEPTTVRVRVTLADGRVVESAAVQL